MALVFPYRWAVPIKEMLGRGSLTEIWVSLVLLNWLLRPGREEALVR
jgi:hypothetical protein